MNGAVGGSWGGLCTIGSVIRYDEKAVDCSSVSDVLPSHSESDMMFTYAGSPVSP